MEFYLLAMIAISAAFALLSHLLEEQQVADFEAFETTRPVDHEAA